MTRKSMFVGVVLFLAGSAWADVGPKGPTWRCAPPDTCVSCFSLSFEPDSGDDCRAGATDAGLEKVACTDESRGTPGTTEYFCPPGTNVGRSCSCSAIDAPFALGLLWLLRARRR